MIMKNWAIFIFRNSTLETLRQLRYPWLYCNKCCYCPVLVSSFPEHTRLSIYLRVQILFSGNFCEKCRGQMTENIRFHKNNITLTDAEKSREKIVGAGVTLASLSSGRKLKLRLKIVSISLRNPFKLLDIWTEVRCLGHVITSSQHSEAALIPRSGDSAIHICLLQ